MRSPASWLHVLIPMPLAFAAQLAAQQPALTLADAVRAALATHPSVAMAQAATSGAEAGVRQARSAWWPMASVDANATRFDEPMVVAPLHGFDPTRPPLFDRDLWQANLAVSWSAFDPQRGSRIDRARAELTTARVTDHGVRQALIARAVAGYLEVATARELAASHAARITALEREAARAAAFVREGRAARLAELRAQAALAAAQADGATAEARREAAERALERLIGAPSGSVAGQPIESVAITASDTVPDRLALVAAADTANPEVARYDARLAVARALRAESRNARLPHVRVLGRLVHYGSGGGAESAEWQGGVALSYPLFTGGARGAEIDRAAAELARATAEAARVRRDVGDGLDRALSFYIAARGRVAALTAAVDQADEVARMERLALDEGAGVQTDYLAALADLLRIRASLAEARAQLVTARVDLAHLTGALSLEWLQAHLES